MVKDIALLNGADHSKMFECTKVFGRGSDRRFYMFYRMICYYANTPHLDKAKLKWWLWKD
ncbi:Pathogenicity locus [Campylobacter concisus]|uniref:Pathogenicity locus n=1 Tax=Campylobacter concisus TaxID=199 RepID=UPI00165F62F0|nr:Pathogenicity locus [Campylobacter concisus]